MKLRINGREASIDPQKFMFAEGRAVEKVTGGTFSEFSDGLTKGSMVAMQALVWIAFKRQDPTLKFSDLDEWNVGDLETEQDEPEAAEPDPTEAAEEAA